MMKPVSLQCPNRCRAVTSSHRCSVAIANLYRQRSLICVVILAVCIPSVGCERAQPTAETRLKDFARIEYSENGEPESVRIKFVELNCSVINQLNEFRSASEIEINESDRDGYPLFAQLSAMENLRTLVLNHVAVDDEEFAELRGAKNLQRLELSQTGLTGTGLKYLSELPIKRLLISDTSLTPEGIKCLTQLKHLEDLELCLPSLAASTLPALAELEHLKTVRILQINFDFRENGGLNCVEGADSIEHLELSGRRLTARVLSAIGRMHNLKSFALQRGLIEDEGLQRLTGMRDLQRLEIHEASGLTDRSLTLLASMRGLKELHLSDTRMSAITLPELAAIPTLSKVEIFGRPLEPEVIDSFFAVNAKCELSTSVEALLESGRQSRSYVSHQPRN